MSKELYHLATMLARILAARNRGRLGRGSLAAILRRQPKDFGFLSHIRPRLRFLL